MRLARWIFFATAAIRSVFSALRNFCRFRTSTSTALANVRRRSEPFVLLVPMVSEGRGLRNGKLMQVMLKLPVAAKTHFHGHAQSRGRIDLSLCRQLTDIQKHIVAGILEHGPKQFLALEAEQAEGLSEIGPVCREPSELRFFGMTPHFYTICCWHVKRSQQQCLRYWSSLWYCNICCTSTQGLAVSSKFDLTLSSKFLKVLPIQRVCHCASLVAHERYHAC